MSGRWRADLARALGEKSLRDSTSRAEGDLEQAVARHLEARGIAVVPGALSPEDEARAQRKQRLKEVQAALLPTPPPLPEPAEVRHDVAPDRPTITVDTPDPQQSAADLLRNAISNQTPTGTMPLNGEAVLNHVTQAISAPATVRDDAADHIRRLLGRSR